MTETLPALPVDLSDLAARAAEFARRSRSAATERAYRSDWADFSGWCDRAGVSPLPAAPATVGAYLSDRAGSLKVATLNRRIAAITVAHRTAGLGLDSGHPAIARVLAGIRRAYGTQQQAKTAILTEDLRRVVRALHHHPSLEDRSGGRRPPGRDPAGAQEFGDLSGRRTRGMAGRKKRINQFRGAVSWRLSRPADRPAFGQGDRPDRQASCHPGRL